MSVISCSIVFSILLMRVSSFFLEPVIAAKAMRDLIVVPCYDTMSEGELVRQAEVIKRVAAGLPARKE